jgi:hypothetical protein
VYNQGYKQIKIGDNQMGNFLHINSKNHSHKTMFIHYRTRKHILTINHESGERIGNLDGYVGYGDEFHYLCPGCITVKRVLPIGEE